MDVRDSRSHNYPPRWNAAPSQDLLVIRRNHQTGVVSLDPLRWGLIPYWCEDPKGGRKDGDRCATNQVPYSLDARGIENDLLPWCEQHEIPLMAYSPLGGPDFSLLRDPTLARIGAAHNCSAAAVALAWIIRSGKVVAIPESGSAAHVRENAVALSLVLTPQELQTLDAAHPVR